MATPRSSAAGGGGVIDFEGVVRVLRQSSFRGTISVECGTEEQAVRSREYLLALLGKDA